MAQTKGYTLNGTLTGVEKAVTVKGTTAAASDK